MKQVNKRVRKEAEFTMKWTTNERINSNVSISLLQAIEGISELSSSYCYYDPTKADRKINSATVKIGGWMFIHQYYNRGRWLLRRFAKYFFDCYFENHKNNCKTDYNKTNFFCFLSFFRRFVIFAAANYRRLRVLKKNTNNINNIDKSRRRNIGNMSSSKKTCSKENCSNRKKMIKIWNKISWERRGTKGKQIGNK